MSIKKKINISLIVPSGNIEPNFKNIIDTINNYLLRNKGAVSDFNLIKDIVDRSVDREEDSISSNLPIPLYLGLIGTMLGIIIGLIGMPALSNNASVQTMQGVDILLSGVKIAMVASACGLIFTTINSYYFHSVRKKTEHKKNDFFTFIQTELLPILSQNTASSVITLQNNLLKFNEGFAYNMTQFNDVLNEVRLSFDSQLQVVEELKRIDVSAMARYNIDVMKEMRISFDKLQELSEYLNNVNGFLNNTKELNWAITKQLEKVGEISNVIERFDNNAVNIAQGSKYLQIHFEQIDTREQAFNNRIADFDSVIDDMVSNLKNSFEDRLNAFNESDVNINSSFETTFDKINTGFEVLFNDLREKTQLIFDDESQNIASIKKETSKIHEAVHQVKTIPTELVELKEKVKKQDDTINSLLQNIAGKPIVFKMSKWMIIAIVVTSVVLVGTCGLFIYKFIYLNV